MSTIHLDTISDRLATKKPDHIPAFAPSLPKQIPSLNGLRAISIFLVFLAHSAGTRNSPGWLVYFMPIGNLGVRVFFVISGFLITTLMFREYEQSGRVSLVSFYYRRALRIFPACYMYIACVVIMHHAGFLPLKPGDLLHAATYTMNYHNEHAWPLNHLWSLAVEEQFYLMWPVVFVFLGPRHSSIVATAAIVFCPVIRTIMWCSLDADSTAMTRNFQAVGDCLALGCLLAGTYNWLGRRKMYIYVVSSRLFPLIPAAGLMLSLATYWVKPGIFYTFGQSIANAAIAVGIDWCVRRPDTFFGRMCNTQVLNLIGILSYSLYLWQEIFLNPFDTVSTYTCFPINILLAVVAALFFYLVVERPFLRLKTLSRRAG